MPKRVLCRFWNIVGGLLAAFTIYSWLASQGGPLLGTSLFPEARPIVAAFYANTLIALLLWFLCLIGISYIDALPRGGSFLSRFPVFAVEDKGDLRPESRSYRLYQGATLFILLILPLAAQVHLARKVFDHAVVWSPDLAEKLSDRGEAIPSVGFDCFLPLVDGERCEALKQLEGRDLKFADRREDLRMYVCYRTRTSCGHFENLNVSPGCRRERRTCRGEDFMPFVTPMIPLLLVIVSSFAVSFLANRAWRHRRGADPVQSEAEG